MAKTKKYSQIGTQSLETVSTKYQFTVWMYEEIKPLLRGHILEVGSGLGIYSKYILKHDPRAVFSDIDPSFISQLEEKFPTNERYLLDISNPDHVSKIGKAHTFDSIVMLNVLEHVEEDVTALTYLQQILATQGKIICLVPAHQWLYNGLDKSVHHFRRYTKKTLLHTFQQAQFNIEYHTYFNCFAIPGWWLHGTLLRKTHISNEALSVFDSLVPMFRFIEKRVLRKRAGISHIISATPRNQF